MKQNEVQNLHLVWKNDKIGHGGLRVADDDKEEGDGRVRGSHVEEEIFTLLPRLEAVHAVQGIWPPLLGLLVVIFVVGHVN